MSMIVTIFAYFLLDKSVKCDEQKLSHLSRKNAKNQSNLRDVWYQCLFHSSKEKGKEKRLFTVISISFFFQRRKNKVSFQRTGHVSRCRLWWKLATRSKQCTVKFCF